MDLVNYIVTLDGGNRAMAFFLPVAIVVLGVALLNIFGGKPSTKVK